MAYINKDGKVGTLYELLPNVSNPVRLTDEELKEKFDIEKYVKPAPPAPKLAELKKQKIVEISDTYNQIMAEGFETSLGFKVDCEDKNITDFDQGLRFAEEMGETIVNIIDYDNVVHSLTLEEFKQMTLELGNHKLTQLFTKQAHRELVNSYTKKADVEAFYWRKPVYSDEDEMVFSHWEYWGE